MTEQQKEQRWKALAVLATSPEGKALLAMLNDRREECRDQLERVPDPAQLHKLQGCADTLKDLIDKISSAPETVRKRYS